MTAQLATREGRAVSRPLKVLIPMINGELELGDTAGAEHYANAGDMLIEAKEQISHGGWGKWLSKNFELHSTTAQRYMAMARYRKQRGSLDFTSLSDLTGDRERRRTKRNSKQEKSLRGLLRELARDAYVQERQSAQIEIELHRKLAEDLINAGFRVLATKLHPDRGGSHDAMKRLTLVRDELKQVAKLRRFV